MSTARIISLISLFVGLVMAIAPLWVDPHVVAVVGGAVITFLGGVSTVLTGQGAQVNAVVNNIDDPTVKRSVVAAVSRLEGVNAIQVNEHADAALISVAADPSVPKVLLPKS